MGFWKRILWRRIFLNLREAQISPRSDFIRAADFTCRRQISLRTLCVRYPSGTNGVVTVSSKSIICTSTAVRTSA